MDITISSDCWIISCFLILGKKNNSKLVFVCIMLGLTASIRKAKNRATYLNLQYFYLRKNLLALHSFQSQGCSTQKYLIKYR